MKLSKDAVEDFQKVYKKVYGIDIDFDLATEEAEGLMRLMYIALEKYMEPKVKKKI